MTMINTRQGENQHDAMVGEQAEQHRTANSHCRPSSGYAADPKRRKDYQLAVSVLQSELYTKDTDIRDLVDAILQECDPIILA